jgi:hypothetical protein
MHFDFDAEFASHKRQMKIMKAMGAAFAVVWVLIFLIVMGIFTFIGYVAYQGISNPALIGEYAGSIVKGYEETVE